MTQIKQTPKAIEGFREVALYIAENFGDKALHDFYQRVKEQTNALKKMPRLGGIDKEISCNGYEYRSLTIYKRSIMVYRIDEDTIYIVDFYDSRHSVPSSHNYN